jgi:hypothetical protein
MRCKTRFSSRILLTCSLFAISLVVLGLAQPAFAAGVDDPSDVFQLDGNTTVDSSICFKLSSAGALLATPPCSNGFALVNFDSKTDDWDAVYHSNAASGSPQAHTTVISFESDLINTTSDNEFTGGGSKDTSGIQAGPWLWNTSKPQAKDDIEDAFAAAYTLANGDTGIYFGMDRYDNSGDATAGFWFFQDSTVDLISTKQGGGFRFSGQHMDGDILIVSDFSTGGPVANIAVYRWTGNDSTGTLVQEKALTAGATCNPSSPGSTLCGIVNGSANTTAVTSAPAWTFKDKSGNSGYLVGEFLEGAIDLQAIFGSSVPCFTRFMAETRSSNSPTASLSDLTKPVNFPLCGIAMTKSCPQGGITSSGPNAGLNFTYGANGTITNIGIGALHNITVTDTPVGANLKNTSGGALSTPVTVFTLADFPAKDGSGNPNCIRWPSGAACSTPENPVQYFRFESTTNGPTNSAHVDAFTATSGGTKVTADSDDDPTKPGNQPAQCPTVQVSPSLTVSKVCSPVCLVAGTNGSADTLQVNFSGKVCNTSNVQLTGVSVVDQPYLPDTTTVGGFVTGTNAVNVSWPASSGVLQPQGSKDQSNNPTDCASYTGSYVPSAGVDKGGDFDDNVHATGSSPLGGSVVPQDSGTQDCAVCPLGNCN